MDPLRPHSHANNALIPDADTTIFLNVLNQEIIEISLEYLQSDYQTSVLESYTYQTDHGRHGPYRLEGVRLIDLIGKYVSQGSEWNQVEVLSADGFGNRIYKTEILEASEAILLCFRSNGGALERQYGLVRLVVPFETDNALRQVKWVRTINVLNAPLEKI